MHSFFALRETKKILYVLLAIKYELMSEREYLELGQIMLSPPHSHATLFAA